MKFIIDRLDFGMTMWFTMNVYLEHKSDDLSHRLIILAEIRAVAEAYKKRLSPLTDDLALLDSGLDSLCFAILVSRLEDITGRDPFTSVSASRYPRTIGDFVALYDEALA